MGNNHTTAKCGNHRFQCKLFRESNKVFEGIQNEFWYHTGDLNQLVTNRFEPWSIIRSGQCYRNLNSGFYLFHVLYSEYWTLQLCWDLLPHPPRKSLVYYVRDLAGRLKLFGIQWRLGPFGQWPEDPKRNLQFSNERVLRKVKCVFLNTYLFQHWMLKIQILKSASVTMWYHLR